MILRHIPYYADYISDELLNYLLGKSQPIAGVSSLVEVGEEDGLEDSKVLQFICDLYDLVKEDLNDVLNQRRADRKFIDERMQVAYEFNRSHQLDNDNIAYASVLGQEDEKGRIVVGPKNLFYCQSDLGEPIASLPAYLQGMHVTFFGPSEDAKFCVTAMNAFYQKASNEPSIIEEILCQGSEVLKWGVDFEDSQTPLRQALIKASKNLTSCFAKNIKCSAPSSHKEYRLEKERLAIPIKRIAGLNIPSLFLFYQKNPIPMHLYDLAKHLFTHWDNPQALSFYVPKLETEEEARYIKRMVTAAETLMQNLHPQYVLGTVRLFIVLENVRAIFRVNEIIDELHPYFAGASLGWHDYLSSMARLAKEDGNYRIPTKTDPNIVIKYIRASHQLLANIVGSRGGVKIGGMYGILPSEHDWFSPSFQVALKGFVKDVVSQLRRNLSGFWVAYPYFARVGLALVEVWKRRKEDGSGFEHLLEVILQEPYRQEVLNFLSTPDLCHVDRESLLYPSTLMVADIKPTSASINRDPEEIRFNVFQTLQYLASWLAGQASVALPAEIEGTLVWVIDDLATVERSRWQIWHEINHGRFLLEEFLKIVSEEIVFIRRDLVKGKKSVAVKWDEHTRLWYPVAMSILVKLATDTKPVEFVTELLLPFTIESIRKTKDPWYAAREIDQKKYSFEPYVERFLLYFGACGHLDFAKTLAQNLIVDLKQAKSLIQNFSIKDIQEAAYFHGDIGENKRNLDHHAQKEQSLVVREETKICEDLQILGAKYKEKFAIKFLISARGKDGAFLLDNLKKRIDNSPEEELSHAKNALWQIACARLKDELSTLMITSPSSPSANQRAEGRLLVANLNANAIFHENFEDILHKHEVKGAMISLCFPGKKAQTIVLGKRNLHKKVTPNTWFGLASLSKPIAACMALEYFRNKKISLQTPVNTLFEKTSKSFRLTSLDPDHTDWADAVTIEHLLNHSALNMHYVNGFLATDDMPSLRQLLEESHVYGYEKVGVCHEPGTKFKYSGGGYLVLEHLLESLEEKSIQELSTEFLAGLKLTDLSFEPQNLANRIYAHGYYPDGTEIEGTRKMFPALAAGAVGTASDVLEFLRKLTAAYHCPKGCGPISHDSAVRMLHGRDLGSQQFMGAKMGLGIFTAEAGPNRLLLHQGANDGFRCLFVYCYSGPDKDHGFVILCNGDLNGVAFVAEASQKILTAMRLKGVRTESFTTQWDVSRWREEEIVNQGYKELIFSAFMPDLPEEIEGQRTLDPLAEYNLAVHAKIISVSNQGFARAQNLLSPYIPSFDPSLFGRQGKIMDSWETIRHNEKECDTLVIKLKKASRICYASISTAFHLGNQAQAVAIEGRSDHCALDAWELILPKVELEGHALHCFKTNPSLTQFSFIRISLFPDGGLTRLGLFDELLPNQEKKKYKPIDLAKPEVFTTKIPQTIRALVPKYTGPIGHLNRKQGSYLEIASLASGGQVLSVSNEHYSPGAQVISPYMPINMFDGFESARSRKKDHYEELILALGRSDFISRIQLDFTYFKNNNPKEVAIWGLSQGEWFLLVDRVNVKAYAGNTIEFQVYLDKKCDQIKVLIFPDGGINRIRIFCTESLESYLIKL